MKQLFDYKHSLHQRFILTAAMMLVPLVILVTIQYSVFNSTIAHLNNVIEHSSLELTSIKQLQQTMHAAVMAPNDYLVHGEVIERANYATSSIKVTMTINNMLKIMSQHPDELDLLEQVDQLWGQIDQKAHYILATTNPVGNTAMAKEMELMDATAVQAISILEQMFSIVTLEIAEESEDADYLRTIMIALIIGGTSISALMILWLNRTLALAVVNPICCLKKAANRVGDGDYSSCLSWERQDEIGELSQSFDAMTEYLEKAHTKLELLACQDGLTGILNRREFDRLFPVEFSRAHRFEHPLSLIMIDLDHFKEVNDTHGHLTGDNVLQIFATLVNETIRDIDQFARYGGEEFILILPEVDREGAYVLAERIRTLVKNTNFGGVDGEAIKITISAGIADYPKNGISEKEMIDSADKALYQAKHGGRNRVVCAEIKSSEV
ncbi:MAG: diguanylate cyclase [Gammaproteobacteria bacterium]|nr:diguanylate cyclase [Gammaproteobacteria bacterium]